MGQNCPHFDKGIYYFQQGMHEKAIEAFTQAIDRKQKAPQSFYNRALAYDALQRYEQAVFDYTQAIQRKNNSATTYLNRGLAYRSLQKFDKALEDFSEAISIDPKLVSAYNSRGNLYKHLQRFQDAIDDYSAAISLNGFQPVLYYNRGLSYASVQNFAKAILDFSATLNLDNKDALAFNNRGVAHSQLNNYSDAQNDYIKALELKPNYPLAMFNLAECYANMQKKNKSAKIFEDAIKSFQDVSYFQKDDKVGSKQNSKNVEFSLSPGNIQFINSAIQAYQKRKKELQELEEQAMELGRNDLLHNLYGLFEKNENISIKNTAKVGKELPSLNQLQQKHEQSDLEALHREMKKMREQMAQIRKKNEQLQGRVGKVQEEQERLREEVNKINEKVFAMERVTKKIQQIDSKKKCQYFDRLYRTLLGHFMAYKILSTGFFIQNTRAFSMKEDVVSSICALHPYVGSIPVIGPMVMMPFNIIAKVRSVKTSHLNSVIARKVGSSSFVTEEYLNSTVAYVIEKLMEEKQFQEEVMESIYQQEQCGYHRLNHAIGKIKGKIQSSLMDSTQNKFSYVEQLVIAHMTLVTEDLTDIELQQFKQISKDKESFYKFVFNAISTLNLKKEFKDEGLDDDDEPPETNRGLTRSKTQMGSQERDEQGEERKGLWSCLRCHC